MDPTDMLCDARAIGEPLVAALVAQDVAAANRLIAELSGNADAMRIDIVDNARVAEAAPVWRIDAPGQTRMRFHPRTWSRYAELILGRWVATLPMLLAALPTLRPGSCSLNLGDEGHVPGLAFCDHRPEFTLIPDAIFMMTRGYVDLARKFAVHRPWRERQPIAFWRGGLTGRRGEGNARMLPRARLCRIGKRHPMTMDFGITDLLETPEPDRVSLRAEGLMRDYVPIDQLDRYQLLIDIDGHSNSWPGLMSKLHSGGVVIKVQSEHGFRQWYYDRLEAWVHYVPVRADLADLIETIDRLLDDPVLAGGIGECGKALARSMTVTEEIRRAAPVISTAIRA